MPDARPLNIGITCYPSVGGSGVLATALGEELAKRGHEVHFISYERPFRLPTDSPRLRFHPVGINDYGLFKYPDYTLPLSVKMAEVAQDFHLDVLHVHYAVPHATAAILARAMLPARYQPAVVTTLHGTDTTLLGRDRDYGPAIQHALTQSDAVTTVSNYLRDETQRLLNVDRPIDVIHNFFSPRSPTRSREQVRRELGLRDELLLFHSSNLRPLKRVDRILRAVARMQSRESFKLLILAGDDFAPFVPMVNELGLQDRVIVREKVIDIEDYLQCADLSVFASEAESFCLSILEAMWFACPSVATRVGGIPEVIEDQASGVLCECGDEDRLVEHIQKLIADRSRRIAMGSAAQARARAMFSADIIVPQYESLYRRVLRNHLPTGSA